ncbi:DUF2125 domain-containing protein [Nioella aestuarii]|uniref:DUF2125 domain-containing protein n=1 Tax=Nioella aestuarii TaxID=1662864 RepID=UPI003D7F5E2E
MSKMKSLSLSLSTAALLAATPAMADINAEQLWAIWQEQATEFGYTLTAQATPNGSGLTLTNITSTMMIEDVSVSGTIPQVTLTNQADGSVIISAADSMTYSITGFDDADAPDAVNIQLSLQGLGGFATGSPEMMTLNSGFERVTVESIDFVGGDPSEIPEIIHNISLDGYGASATYDFTNPAMLGFTSSGTLSGLTFDVEMFEPASGAEPELVPAPQPNMPAPGKVVTPAAPQPTPLPAPTGGRGDGHLNLSIALAGMESTSTGTMPRGIDWMTIDTFPAGFSISGDATYNSASAGFMFVDTYENVDFSASNTGGSIGFGVSEENLRYALAATGVTLNLATNEMPFPVAASADSTALSIDMPLAQSATPSPFSATIAYQGVAVEESLWAMVDPGQAIPRTPATVIVDLSGTVQLFVDLMMIDPESMMAPPGELRDLTLNNLQVSFGGAELTGSGDVDFAPGQMIPMPVGAVNLSLTGANTLIQSLSEGGLLPPQQAGMARGMLGMFAIPGASPDSYTSTVEFLPGGGITANGVPLQ